MTVLIEDEYLEFEWDDANYEKNWIKHKVSVQEIEEAFVDEYKIVFLDIKHLNQEKRYVMFAQSILGRLLSIVYTQRQDKVRIISARDASTKEEKYYEETTRTT